MNIHSAERTRLASDFGWRLEDVANCVDGLWRMSSAAETSRGDYPDAGHDLCAATEDLSPWFAARNKIIHALAKQYLPRPVLWEIGAGNGAVSIALAQKEIETVAIEPSPAIGRAVERGVPLCISAYVEDLKLPSASLPAVGLFDVIEHLPDPQELLREVHRLLEPNGILLLTVPAYQALWSDVDEWSGHFRRFSKRSLTNCLQQANFTQRDAGAFMLPLLLPVFLLRAFPYRLGIRRNAEALQKHFQSSLAPQQGIADKALRMALELESAYSCPPKSPLGTSLWGVFQKKG